MEIYRKLLAIGLLTEENFLTLSYRRKILFVYDVDNTKVAHDVINCDMKYPIGRTQRKNDFYVAHTISLDPVLESLGYPEILEDVHIDRIMNEDFEKVFVETGYISELYRIAQESMLPKYEMNNYQYLKDEFKIRDKEIKKREKQNTKRSWFC